MPIISLLLAGSVAAAAAQPDGKVRRSPDRTTDNANAFSPNEPAGADDENNAGQTPPDEAAGSGDRAVDGRKAGGQGGTPPPDPRTPPPEPFGSSAGASANYRPPQLLGPAGDDGQREAAAEPGQLLVWHADLAAARAFGQAVARDGYRLRGRTVLDALGVVQTVLGLPQDVSIATAAEELSRRFPDAVIDANSRYRPLQDDGWALEAVGWDASVAPCGARAAVGLVDTGVDPDHPLLASRDLVHRSVLPAGIPAAPAGHGTAVAGRLVQLLPRARLHVASAFRLRDGEITDTTAEWLLQALDWLAGEGVAAINLSLGGPRNRLLALAVERLRERRIALAASVAETGPGGAPMYPAAYDGVIGVTAVDARLAVLDRARRGTEVDLAAPGVDLRLAGMSRYLTGTSHAAPFATAALVLAGGLPGVAAAARDLGPPGRDETFGEGLVRFEGLCTADADAG